MSRHGCLDKVLICLPTYHSNPEWLERCTESLLKQTFKSFDCYVVKDGCSGACTFSNFERTCLECDNCKYTQKYFEDICSKDERFKFFTLPVNHSGAGWAPRNFAIMNTKHDLIAYLDDDNWYEPDHIESLYRTITDTKSDMCYTGTRLYDSNKKVVGERIHNDIPKAGYIDTSEIMHTRYLIEKHGGWRYVKKCNDWDIVSRWVPDVKWSHTNKVTLNFFLRDGCGIHRK
jgi:cellulose synthase/poly-beta-1,6-N-acetylglucosamine synthase-like glycosyltransferase